MNIVGGNAAPGFDAALESGGYGGVPQPIDVQFTEAPDTAPGASDSSVRLEPEITFDGLTDRLAGRAEALGERSLQWSGLQGSGGVDGGVDRLRTGDVGPLIAETDASPPLSFGEMMANFNSAYSHATEVSLVSAGLTGMSKSLNKLMSGS